VAKQTASVNLAVKALAYGIPGIKVDGNDYLAVYQAVREAKSHTALGLGPVLIEALTYRRGAHTTSDDPSLYRTEEEEKSWELKDPLRRLRLYLGAKGLWREDLDTALEEEYRLTVEQEFSFYENHAPYPLEDVFKYHFQEMPEHLRRQLAEQQRFQKWQEVNQ
jgi:pyruvate dehydrogenase E1 component alpha subunit